MINNIITDCNGRVIRVGDIVEITGAYFKADNGLYFVESAPGFSSRLGSGLYLKKISKSGKISTAKYSSCSWPLVSYTNSRIKAHEAKVWNTEHAAIKLSSVSDMRGVVAAFKEKVKSLQEAAERETWRYGSDSPDAVRDRKGVSEYEAVIARIIAETMPDGYIEEAPKPADNVPHFVWNGVKINNKLYRGHYSGNDTDGVAVTLYMSDYEDTPRVAGIEVENDSDIMTDYFERDTVTVRPNSEYYAEAVKAQKSALIHCAKVSIKNTEKNFEAKKGTRYEDYYKKELEDCRRRLAELEEAAEAEKKKAPAPAAKTEEKNKAETKTSTEQQDIESEGPAPVEDENFETKQRIYFRIDEQTAKLAHEMMSMSDYREGSRTAEYKNLVDKAYTLAERIAKERPKQAEKARNLAQTYARKLADNFNAASQISTRCPSVLIAGFSNFPVRKKQKQVAAWDKNSAEYIEIQSYVDHLNSILHSKEVICSDDVDAIEQLEDKLKARELDQEKMKAVNAYYRKNGKLDGCTALTFEETEKLKSEMLSEWHWADTPYLPFELSNNNAEIRRIKERIKTLKKAKSDDAPDCEYKNLGLTVIENAEIMRLQFRFDEIPAPEVREIMKSYAFKWSPRNGCWQRLLTDNAKYAGKKIIERLQAMCKKEEDQQLARSQSAAKGL